MIKLTRVLFALTLSLVLLAFILVLMSFASLSPVRGDNPISASAEAFEEYLQVSGVHVMAHGGLIYQDFEGENPADMGWGEDCSVTRTTSLTQVHSGQFAWEWRWDSGTDKRTFIRFRKAITPTDLLRDTNDRLVFWIYSEAAGGGAGQDQTVSVTFYSGTHSFEVRTRQKARYGQWTKLAILFDQLPDKSILHAVDKIAFKMYWPGTYYLDDIQAVREDRVYQSFEPGKFGGITDTAYYGWSWFYPTSTVALSGNGEPVYEGDHSWKLFVGQNWDGTAIRSEQEYYSAVEGTQVISDVNLDPDYNDQLILWVYALPQNGLDNNLNVQFYDRGMHSSYTNCVSYWTDRTPAVYGQWSRLSVPFTTVLKIAPDLDLKHIDKIQVQAYWPGTYYIDKIEAVSSVPEWDNRLLANGTLQWFTNRPLDRYRLQENTFTGDLRDNNWVDVYTGTGISYVIPHISRAWYRVRAEEVESADNEVPFVSTWSDALEYNPPAILIDKSALMESQVLTWTHLSYATVYTVESMTRTNGLWTVLYSAAYPTAPLSASVNTWYRVRAGTGTEESNWSPPQWKPDPIDQDILRTFGTTIRRGPAGEIGDVVTLRGVNLGNYLLIEPWINGWVSGTITATNETDYYTLRQILENRFGVTDTLTLLQTYHNSYLTDVDFDILMRMGVSLIRLPIYYRDLQDDAGQVITEGFKNIDRVVEASADRGMYVLLDLHGAPGAQTQDCYTGRCGWNKLFQGTPDEQALYQTRTVELWEAIASRYMSNTTVMGYDLLNEPTGAATNQLWDLYDRLYHAIRAQDPKHIIVMEPTWDLDTLPPPSKYGWENIVYSPHTYCAEPWCGGKTYTDRVESHKKYIHDKIALIQRYQDGCHYKVPILIGEFNAFDSRDAWEYYLDRFNDQGWSWAMWTYKMAIPNSNWGLLTDRYYDVKTLPKFREESTTTLTAKLSEQFSTTTRYLPNESLVSVVGSRLTETYAMSAVNRFQAEYYDDAEGVATHTTPVGHIGSLDTGDWVRYNAIKFTEGLTTFVANLAVDNAAAGKQIVIRLDNRITGTIVGTVTVAGTGGWWDFFKQKTPISPITGVHDVYLIFRGDGVANMDWFTFRGNDEPYALSASNRFQAECCDAWSSGVVREEYYIGSLDPGDWARYDAIEFSKDPKTFVASLAVTDSQAGGQIQVRLDQVTGTIVGTLTVTGTGGWWTFAEQRVPISPVTGVHDVYLTFTGTGGVANIDWFTFRSLHIYLPLVLKNWKP